MIRHRIISALAAVVLLAAPAGAAPRKPIVLGSSGQQQQIQSGDTLLLQAPTTAAASINLPHGTAPTSPANGDCWTTTAGFYCRISGSTVGPMSAGSTGTVTTTGSPASGNLARFSGSSSITNGDLSGDVTTSGALTTTIGAGAVSLSKMANLAANSIMGNNTGSAATPIALTATQATAMLNTFTSSLNGLAPASAGGTTNFLRADGSWAAPAGGGGSSNPWWWSPPTAASFSAETGDATSPTAADDTNIGMVVDAKTSVVGDKVRAMVETITSPSADWTYDVRFVATQPPNDFTTTGIWIYNTTSAKGVIYGFGDNSQITAARRTLSAFSASIGLANNGPTAFDTPFLRVTFTASTGTLTFYVGEDGKYWRRIGSELVSSYITNNPDRIGFGAALAWAGTSADTVTLTVGRRVKSW